MPGRLAAWGRGVVATIARAVGLSRLRPKCGLRMAVMYGVNLRTWQLSSTFTLQVTNIGREPVVVSGIALRRRSTTGEYCFSSRNLPKLLEPNDSVIQVFDCPGTLLTDADALYAYDSRGIEWQLPQKELKKLLKHICSH